eukprot:1154691-Alexandrium_andersonii.AAC.1
MWESGIQLPPMRSRLSLHPLRTRRPAFRPAAAEQRGERKRAPGQPTYRTPSAPSHVMRIAATPLYPTRAT